MKQVLFFETGETTCSVEPNYPGSLCRFAVPKTGGGFKCTLYYNAVLTNRNGWLQRLPQCLSDFKGYYNA